MSFFIEHERLLGSHSTSGILIQFNSAGLFHLATYRPRPSLPCFVKDFYESQREHRVPPSIDFHLWLLSQEEARLLPVEEDDTLERLLLLPDDQTLRITGGSLLKHSCDECLYFDTQLVTDKKIISGVSFEDPVVWAHERECFPNVKLTLKVCEQDEGRNISVQSRLLVDGRELNTRQIDLFEYLVGLRGNVLPSPRKVLVHK